MTDRQTDRQTTDTVDRQIRLDYSVQSCFDTINVAHEKPDVFFMQGANARTPQNGNSERFGTCSSLFIYVDRAHAGKQN